MNKEDLTDTILEFDIFKEECPLGFEFTKNSLEEKSQDKFYEDDGEFCEKNCDNDDHKKCWIKFFKEMKRLKEVGNRK